MIDYIYDKHVNEAFYGKGIRNEEKGIDNEIVINV